MDNTPDLKFEDANKNIVEHENKKLSIFNPKCSLAEEL
jgi:hypothetical protein